MYVVIYDGCPIMIVGNNPRHVSGQDILKAAIEKINRGDVEQKDERLFALVRTPIYDLDYGA